VKKQQIGLGVRIQPKEGGKEAHVIETTQRMQFFREDNKALVQIGPDRLSINHLRPYPKWVEFKPLILDVLRNYVATAAPKGFKRIGLKYVNKIEIKEKVLDLKEYFKFFPTIPENIPKNNEGFQLRIEIPYGERDRLLLTLGSIDSPDEVSSVLLDLDFILIAPESILVEGAAEWLEEAHNNIEYVFEACITDKCRNLFKEEK